MVYTYFKKVFFSALSFAGFITVAQAQLTIQGGIPPQTLVQNTLLSPGVIISNFQFNGTIAQVGRFNGTNSNIGINTGMVICTGNVFSAPGPNLGDLNNAGTDLFLPGDNDLDQLTSNSTQDAFTMSFDFVAYNDTVEFNYVFASEEYPEFVNAGFNDVFAFFISGPGFPPGGQNIALIPGTGQPVTIDNVNDGNNSQYYIDNAGGTTVNYDGFTVKLKALAVVQPCSTYTIKIGIADVLDGDYDSAVFLEAQSFSSGNANVSVTAGNITNINDSLIVEGCIDGVFAFTRGNNFNDTTVVNYTVGGTATNGVDYAQIADSVVFYPGDTTFLLNIDAFFDGVTEGGETVTITLNPSELCQNIPTQTVTIVINNVEPIAVDITPNTLDVASCTQVQFTANATGGSAPLIYTWNNGLPNAASQTLYPNSPVNTYTVIVSDACGTPTDTATITVNVTSSNPITAQINFNDTTLCQPDVPLSFTLNATATGGQGDLTYTWSDGSIGNSVAVTPTETTTYTITVTDTCGNTVGIDSVTIAVLCGVVVPNVFTPNGDNANDLFVIANLEQFPGSELFIYNRWGRKVYTSADYKNNWDGGNLSEGVYYYTLNIPAQPKKMHGTVTILK